VVGRRLFDFNTEFGTSGPNAAEFSVRFAWMLERDDVFVLLTADDQDPTGFAFLTLRQRPRVPVVSLTAGLHPDRRPPCGAEPQPMPSVPHIGRSRRTDLEVDAFRTALPPCDAWSAARWSPRHRRDCAPAPEDR
jgi:hypothetical protein